MIIYPDLIAMLNFAVDYLLLLGTNRLLGFPPDYGKVLPAALLGGGYAAVCSLPEFYFLGGGFWRLVFLVLIGGIAFGWNRTAVQRTAVYLLLSMALGGIAVGAGGRHIPGLLICGALLWSLCRVGFWGSAVRGEYVTAALCWNGRCVRLLALRDTGNTLRDPLTGEQVLVCGADVGEELLGIPRASFRDPVAMVGSVPGFRLIPYHCVGKDRGMLPAIRLDRSEIGGIQRKPLVAFAPEEIGKGQVYRMLTGGVI